EVVRPVQDDVCLFRQGFEKRAVTMAYVSLEFEVRPDLEEPLLSPRRFRRLFPGVAADKKRLPLQVRSFDIVPVHEDDLLYPGTRSEERREGKEGSAGWTAAS